MGLDFVSPESLGEAVTLAEEIRCLPNDHEAKLQVLEVRQRKFSLEVFSSFLFHLSPFFLYYTFKLVKTIIVLFILVKISHFLYWVLTQVGKISLYAASSAIKEVQKLVLDPK